MRRVICTTGTSILTNQKRAVGFVRGNGLYIALLYTSHEEYERDLPNHTAAEFEKRLREFLPWTVPVEESTPPTEMPDEWEELKAANAGLTRRIANLEEIIRRYEQQEAETLFQMQHLEQQVTELTKQVEQWRLQAEGLIREKEGLEANNRSLQQEMEKLRWALAQAKRPWWRKLLSLPAC